MIATRNQDNKKHGGRPTVADGKRLSKAVTVKFSKKDYEILRTRSRKAEQKDVEFCCEAAFTGELLNEFKHSNIADNHM